MPDTAALVRATHASRRQLELWRHQGLLVATITHGRAEYDNVEILVARALYRLSALGVMPGGRLANDTIEAIRTGKTARMAALNVGFVRIDLQRLTRPNANGDTL